MSTSAPRLPEHPPHEPHVPCVDVVNALAKAPEPPAETKTPTAVDLPVPRTRSGPLTRAELGYLRSIRALNAEGQKRSERAMAEARSAVAAENEATLRRWDEFHAAVAEAHGALVAPEGHRIRDVVEGGETFLVVEPIPAQAKPAQPARMGS